MSQQPDLQLPRKIVALFEKQCEKGNISLVSALLQNKDFTVEAMTDGLCAAAKHNQLAVARLLLNDKRSNPSCEDNYPLCKASENGYVEMVKLLLADPRLELRETLDDYSLGWAARNNHVEIVKLLLEDGRIHPFPDSSPFFSSTAYGHQWGFSWACEYAHPELVKLFLKDHRFHVPQHNREAIFMAKIRDYITSAAGEDEEAEIRRTHADPKPETKRENERDYRQLLDSPEEDEIEHLDDDESSPLVASEKRPPSAKNSKETEEKIDLLIEAATLARKKRHFEVIKLLLLDGRFEVTKFVESPLDSSFDLDDELFSFLLQSKRIVTGLLTDRQTKHFWESLQAQPLEFCLQVLSLFSFDEWTPSVASLSLLPASPLVSSLDSTAVSMVSSLAQSSALPYLQLVSLELSDNNIPLDVIRFLVFPNLMGFPYN